MAKTRPAKPATAAKTEDVRRFQRAELACNSAMDCLCQLDREGGLASYETAAQYLRMAQIYYKRVRNGKVMGPADFNHAVDVVTAARRALLAIDEQLEFAGWDAQTDMRDVLQKIDGVLADYRQLKAGGTRTESGKNK